MKKISLFALLSASVAMQAGAASATFLVDFNAVSTGGGYPGSDTWNTFAEPSDIVSDGSLLDTSGAGSSLTLSYAGTLLASGNGGAAVYDSGEAPSWVAVSGKTSAADYFYTDTNSGSQASFTMTFSGLTAGAQVSLDLWTSRVSSTSGVGFYEYSLDGGASWLGLTVLENTGVAASTDGWDTNTTVTKAYQAKSDGNDAGRYMSSQSVALSDGTDSLLLRATDSGGGWVSLGAVRLTVIPEPGTYALLAGLLAMFALAVRRR